MPVGDLRLLRSLSTLLDLQGSALFAPDGATKLAAALDAAEELVSHDQRMHEGVRHYLHALINEVRGCLKQIDQYGETPARSATFRLTGAMQFAASTSLDPKDDEAKGRWADAVKGLLYPFIAGTAGQVAGAVMKNLLGM